MFYVEVVEIAQLYCFGTITQKKYFGKEEQRP